MNYMSAFKHKTIDGHVHSVYSYRRTTEEKQPGQQIWYWWRQRLWDGSQLTNKTNYRPMFDYRGGNGQWFLYVAVEALHFDYTQFSGENLSLNQFRLKFYRLLGSPIVKTKPGRLDRGGSTFLRPYRRFIRFRNLEYYCDRFIQLQD